jgi:adenosylcobinamide-GDP ribazoletransferase
MILAFQFLTVIPLDWLGRRDGETGMSADLAKAMAYFPIVGVAQGILLVVSLKLFSLYLPVSVASALVLAVLTLTNFGFHLDGFADTLDGLAGGKTKDDTLRIMRDGHIGPIGVSGLVVFLIIEYVSIAALARADMLPIIFLFPVVARWAMVPMSFLSDYARTGSGLGKPFSRATPRTLIISSSVTIILALLFAGPGALIMLVLVAVAVYIISLYFKKKLGGVTGDIFGFQSEIAGLLFLLLALASIN